MKRSQVSVSEAAVSDILEQAEWYENHSGSKLAKRWQKAVTTTLLRAVKVHAPEHDAASAPMSSARSDAFLLQDFRNICCSMNSVKAG